MSPRLLTAPAVVAVLAGGFYVISRNVPTGGLAAIGAGVAWVAVATAVFAWLTRRDRAALQMVVGASVITVLVGGYLIRPQGNVVDEEIVSGERVALGEPAVASKAEVTPDTDAEIPRSEPARNVEVLSGTFTGESGHRGRGEAAVVELAGGGRKLTFSDFDVDPGAGGLRVYLAAGRPSSDGEVKDFIDLAPLKGTTGDQQFNVPADIDLSRYSTVIVWCVPFTTRIAQSTLG